MTGSRLILEDPLKPSLTPLERAVMDNILEGEHPALVALRRQLEKVIVSSREFSGAGFFTNFTIPATIPLAPLPYKTHSLGNVIAKIPGLKNDAGFILFVENGYLDMLEGFSFGEFWPKDISTFELYYLDPEKKRLTSDLEEKG